MARILVIDDEPFIRFTVKSVLTKARHKIVEACDGQEGVDAFKAEDFDLVITDIIMPKKEGLEVIGEILDDDPDAIIIAMSAGGRTKDLDVLALARAKGARDTIKKPFTAKDLLKAVDDCLVG